MSTDIKLRATISTSATLEFETLEDLERFVEVLAAGLEIKPIFNEDLNEVLDELRAHLDNHER